MTSTNMVDLFIHPTATIIQPKQPSSHSRQPPKTPAPLIQTTPSSLCPSSNSTSPPVSSAPASTMSSALLETQPSSTSPSKPLSFFDHLLISSSLSASQVSPSSTRTSTISGFPEEETFLVQLAQANKKNVDDTETLGIPFKIWRSRHMARSALADEHDNIPVDAPLPSTKREKYHRTQLRAIQLQHYQERFIREGRQQRRQRQRVNEEIDDNDDNQLETEQQQRQQQQQQQQDAGRRVRFTLPSKLKRSRFSSFSDD